MATGSPPTRPGARPGPASRARRDSSALATGSLSMVCLEEPPSKAQKAKFNSEQSALTNQMNKLVQMVERGAKVVRSEEGVLFRVTETSTVTPVGASHTTMSPISPGPVALPIVSSSGNISTPAPASKRRSLVVDKRTGVVLATVEPGQKAIITKPVGANTPARVATNTPLRAVTSTSQSMVANNGIAKRGRASPVQPTSVCPPTVIDLTNETPLSLSEKVAVEKLRKWPSLLVQPRTLKTPGPLASWKEELDSKVKSLLVKSPRALTEWLLQDGLILKEQKSTSDPNAELKLVVCSDSNKFPLSGGYTWLLEKDGKKKFVSVFKGSIFERIPIKPSDALKLMYHWACQTAVHNVVQWVRVDYSVINTYYELLRAVCSASVQEEMCGLGGTNKYVEIGLIKIEVPSCSKQKNYWLILGIHDRSSTRMRLRVIESSGGSNINDKLNVLPVWVKKGSKLIVDSAVSQDYLRFLGYSKVIVSGSGSKKDGTNGVIMKYLKHVVPTPFRNSLRYLSVSAIQGLLDELTFREMFGCNPLQAFDELIKRIAVQTTGAFALKSTFMARCKSIASNPFHDSRIVKKPDPTAPNPRPTAFFEGEMPFTSHLAHAQKRKSSNQKPAGHFIPKRPKVLVTEQVNLESYYYATFPGDVQSLSAEFKADMVLKCDLCGKLVTNNIDFMKHLSLHVRQGKDMATIDMLDLFQCKYCFQEFHDGSAMEAHISDIHFHKEASFCCKICSLVFPIKENLVGHMSTMHVASEMPYGCTLCGFRCSNQREFMEHFEESHDRTDKLLCPRCLRVFPLYSGDEGFDSTVAATYFSHLQSHSIFKRLACQKCALVFTTSKDLKGHSKKDHKSYKGCAGLLEYQYSSTEIPTTMTKPEEHMNALTIRPRPDASIKQQQFAFTANNMEDTCLYNVDQYSDSCKECKKLMSSCKHYRAYFCCTKCRYSTCCSNAMDVHVQGFHGSGPAQFDIGKPTLLESDMQCYCGYKTKSGNKMAKHMGANGCKTVYLDTEASRQALETSADETEVEVFDPNVEMALAYQKSLDKVKTTFSTSSEGQADSSTISQSPKGPLAFLGLQRKQNENEGETKEASEAPELPDKEGQPQHFVPETYDQENVVVRDVSCEAKSESMDQGDKMAASASPDRLRPELPTSTEDVNFVITSIACSGESPVGNDNACEQIEVDEHFSVPQIVSVSSSSRSNLQSPPRELSDAVKNTEDITTVASFAEANGASTALTTAVKPALKESESSNMDEGERLPKIAHLGMALMEPPKASESEEAAKLTIVGAASCLSRPSESAHATSNESISIPSLNEKDKTEICRAGASVVTEQNESLI